MPSTCLPPRGCVGQAVLPSPAALRCSPGRDLQCMNPARDATATSAKAQGREKGKGSRARGQAGSAPSHPSSLRVSFTASLSLSHCPSNDSGALLPPCRATHEPHPNGIPVTAQVHPACCQHRKTPRASPPRSPAAFGASRPAMSSRTRRSASGCHSASGLHEAA